MIVLKTTDEYKFGQTNIVSHLGEIKIGEDGLIHIPDDRAEEAKLLVDRGINFFFHGEEIKPQTKESEEDLSKKKENDDIKPQIEEVEVLDEFGYTPEKNAMIELIQSKSQPELVAFCKEAGFPRTEWEFLKKADIKKYLIRKL